MPLLDQSLELRAGSVADAGREQTIQPLVSILSEDFEYDDLG